MLPRRLDAVLALFMLMVFNASGPFVGINIGTGLSDLPSATDIVSILKAKKIQHVRLVDSDHQRKLSLGELDARVEVHGTKLLNGFGIPIFSFPTLRRERIAERLRVLQELVPNTNKTGRAAMLDEILDYVKFLRLQVKGIPEEPKKMCCQEPKEVCCQLPWTPLLCSWNERLYSCVCVGARVCVTVKLCLFVWSLEGSNLWVVMYTLKLVSYLLNLWYLYLLS